MGRRRVLLVEAATVSGAHQFSQALPYGDLRGSDRDGFVRKIKVLAPGCAVTRLAPGSDPGLPALLSLLRTGSPLCPALLPCGSRSSRERTVVSLHLGQRLSSFLSGKSLSLALGR